MNIREIQNKKQYAWIYTLVLIPFIYFLFVMIVPLGTSIYYSLTKWKGVGSPKFIGLHNYITLIKTPDFWLVTRNTLILCIVCTIGQVGIALLIAFLMTFKKLRFKTFHRAVIFFPVVMAAIVVGYVWRFIYNSNYGLLNTFLMRIGKADWIRYWLDDKSIVLGMVSIPVIWQYIGLYMIILMSAISAIPQEVFECAEIDGCTGYKKSIYITLPMIWDTLKICIILCASGTMKIYDHLVALTNGGPGRATESLAMYCYEYTFKFGNFGMGAAIAVTILIFAFTIAGIIQLVMGGKKK
ncbi:carbohydrate ABC transporter membrane protein 1 (CUT1 family) [Lachnotalea glycerini]|uniref:Carbohydrate ABC transporter membrane protein 1 (CUT1 family) n=1 Tax=Lachnotalea glycerini TaxID=1763509 RepID=A0A255IT69_9FIRM|nr:sugar ABC transporter permease [Lachnotalea glycerini]PXV93393.1 carbohydrate ABC transporter membrane protein 1 (CUT1 family) [Lachnotalea glycerini]RDY30282.1 sugar ABC transporter permease [Lachnotalea glycerini]